MNTQQTISQLRKLKLNGMANRYELMLELSGEQDQPDAHTIIAMLSEAESHHRNERRTQLYIKQARFRYDVSVQDVDCSPERGLTKENWLVLCESNYIRQGKNILVNGPTGCGKSHLA